MKPNFLDIFITAIFLCLILVGSSVFGDPGVGWHLKTGQWIVENAKLPQHDIFLLGDSGNKWINDQWLADLLFWEIYAHTSWGFLQIVTVSICILPFLFWLFPLVQEESNSLFKSAIIFLLVFLLASIQWFFRPVIVSFLFFNFIYSLSYLDLKRNHVSRGNFFLPFIFLLWANMHPAFILGLLILGFVNLERIYQKRFSIHYFILSLISFFCTFFNPWGLELYNSIFSLIGSKFFMNLNSEWLSPDFYLSIFTPYLIVLLIFAVFARNATKKLSFFETGLLVIFLIMSLSHRRYIPFFAIVSALPLAKVLTLNYALSKRTFVKRILEIDTNLTKAFVFKKNFSYALILILIFSVYQLTFSDLLPQSNFSKDVSENKVLTELDSMLVAESDLNCKIFNHPDFGGLLSWVFFTKRRHFIDDRNQLLGELPYQNFLDVISMRGKWQDFLQKNNFCWLLLNTNDPLVKAVKSKEIANLELIQISKEKNMALIRHKID